LLVVVGLVVEQPMFRKLTTSARKNAVRIIISNEDLKDIGKLIGINKGEKDHLTYLWEVVYKLHFAAFFSR